MRFNSTPHRFEVDILLVTRAEDAVTPGEKSPAAARIGAPQSTPSRSPLASPGQKEAALSGLAVVQWARWPDKGN